MFLINIIWKHETLPVIVTASEISKQKRKGGGGRKF
jgi:hypothetical protein